MINVQTREAEVTPSFRVVLVWFLLILGAFLCVFISPLAVCVPLVGVVYVWMPFRYPIVALGLVLAWMPLDFMAIAIGKFWGLPHMTLVSVLDKEIILLVLGLILWGRNEFHLETPDRFLFACALLALARTCVDGTLGGLALDLDFMVPYLVGRVTVIGGGLESVWAKRAVWIAGGLSVLGMLEIFVLGEGPRTALYMALDSEIERGQLAAPFHGTGLAGLREAATMVGPNGFAALCMIALIIWWVYCRNPLPAALVAAGLVCTVTRAAWLGTAVGISVLAVKMGQAKRLYVYAALAFVLFLAMIPVLGLSDYVYYNKTGQDSSAEFHRHEIISGLEYDLRHPFGSGNKTISPVLSHLNENAIYFETTYPAFAAAYGIPAALCFIGFLYTCIRVLWRSQTRVAHAALGILVAMCVVMIFTNSLIDRRLISWAWFPIGLAVRSCMDSATEKLMLSGTGARKAA